ncbi:MAG: hypothetical protein LBR36_08965 [Bacteroidales bacterium]|jgi:hypothetical protein|nr:hypothetical protein [Bacteroidales bacterium]
MNKKVKKTLKITAIVIGSILSINILLFCISPIYRLLFLLGCRDITRDMDVYFGKRGVEEKVYFLGDGEMLTNAIYVSKHGYALGFEEAIVHGGICEAESIKKLNRVFAVKRGDTVVIQRISGTPYVKRIIPRIETENDNKDIKE